MKQNRFKSWLLWSAVAGLIGMALLDTGVFPSLDRYNEYVNVILTILALAGIINNPTDKKKL